jgi:hypothetical protein
VLCDKRLLLLFLLMAEGGDPFPGIAFFLFLLL